MKTLLKYKDWFLFLLVLLVFLLYLDKKIMLFIGVIKSNYPSFQIYLKSLSNLIEILYRISIILVIVLGFYNFFSKTKKEKGIKIILVLVIVGILSQIKYLLGRARPKTTLETIFTGPTKKYAYASFPSGHTFFIFAVAKILAYYYPKYRILFYLFAIVVALERLLNFAHFPSDILAGAFLGNYISNFIIKKKLKN